MYLQEITLRNIKCFENLTLDFSETVHHPDDVGSIRRWTTLFGMNGLGKSTLLQAMGIVLAGPSAAKELMGIAEGWVRKGCNYGEIEARLLWTKGDSVMKRPRKSQPFTIRYLIAGEDSAQLPPSLAEKPNSGEIIAWSGQDGPKTKEAYTKDRLMLQETAYQEQTRGWLSCGYGPFRRLSGGSEFANKIVAKGRRAARYVTLFREDAAVTNAAEWLTALHNESRDGYDDSTKALECVRSALRERLFPEAAELIVDSKIVQVKRAGQDAFLFQDLSDGYRSMLSLSVDLLRWLTKAFPSEPDIMNCSGVVLIDELDTHLHPRWQREIGFWLRDKFPNIQFIIGTHSPFLAQVTDEAPMDPLDMRTSSNIKLIQTTAGVSAVTARENARVLSPEQILQGELFNMESVLSPPVEKKRQRQADLSRKGGESGLDADEQEELRQLSFELDRLPIGSTIEDRAKETAVRAAVEEAKPKIQGLK
jgi:predicted ATPase